MDCLDNLSIEIESYSECTSNSNFYYNDFDLNDDLIIKKTYSENKQINQFYEFSTEFQVPELRKILKELDTNNIRGSIKTTSYKPKKLNMTGRVLINTLSNDSKRCHPFSDTNSNKNISKEAPLRVSNPFGKLADTN